MGGCSRNIDRIPIPFSPSLKWFPVKIARLHYPAIVRRVNTRASEAKVQTPFDTTHFRGWVARVWFCPKEKKSER